MSKKLWIDCVAGSQLKDTQGEILNVEGADITDLEAGLGRWNDNHGKGFFNSLGCITEAKKIFKAEDCENDRQTYYWDKIKAPYIYAKGYLYSDDDHQNAKAAAAIIRNINKTDAPLKMKASVEGGVIARGLKDAKLLARTKIHSVALTFTPANNATLVEPLSLNKTEYNEEADYELMKSVMHLAETNVPSFRHISRTATANKIVNNLDRIEQLAKEAGIEMTISKSTADQLVEKAVKDKIRHNMELIHKAVKGIKGSNYAPEAGKEKYSTSLAPKPEAVPDSIVNAPTARDKYIQGISQQKMDPTVPRKQPINPQGVTGTGKGAIKVKQAPKLNSEDVYNKHANILAGDDLHAGRVKKQLAASGASSKQIAAVMAKLTDMKKSDDLEKDDIARAGKNILLAGALTIGANNMSNKENKPEIKKPKEEKVLEMPKPKKEGRFKGEQSKYFNDLDIKQKARADKVKAKYKEEVKKALSAGYGGGGSPTSQSGGGVFQSESLENDGRSFKYITCDKCGNEQIQSKHQVKCRKCNKNFSLSKVFDMI